MIHDSTFQYIKGFHDRYIPWVISTLPVLMIIVVYCSFSIRANALFRQLKVLLVIAHPDDECMFFTPVILSLLKRGCDIHVLCLTTGNAMGLGKVRRKELLHAVSVLGMPRQNVRIIDDLSLPDSSTIQWPLHIAEEIVRGVLLDLLPNVVLTFDNNGITNHVNHVNTSQAVQRAVLSMEISSPRGTFVPPVWALETVWQPRHYLSFFDLFFTIPTLFVQILRSPISSTNTVQHIVFFELSALIYSMRAMMKHSSQFVWFRILWVIFSRYSIINTLKKVSTTGPPKPSISF